jgi:ABC-2 type transport system ATP-binding protein
MIRFDKVNYVYKTASFFWQKAGERKSILKDLDLHVQNGEIFGIIGPNGCGKTTLLKLAVGALAPCSGNVTTENSRPPSLGDRMWKQQVGFVSGAVSKLFSSFDLNEHIALYQNIYRDFQPQWLKQKLHEFELSDKLSRKSANLSFGERIKFEMILTLAANPKFILLDEPTVGLDVVATEQMRIIISEYVNKNKATAMLTSHNLKDITSLCARAAFLSQGNLKDQVECKYSNADALEATYRRFYT